MRVAVFGATGRVGTRAADELLRRGHWVTGVIRGRPPTAAAAAIAYVTADVADPGSVALAVRDHDAVVSAVGPGRGEPETAVVRAASGLVEGLRRARVHRLVVVGGAGSLRVATGALLLDTPDFPPDRRPLARAHRMALEVLRRERELEWSYLSPAAQLVPGIRTGRYRTGSDQLLVDPSGVSSISLEDLAVAIVDELEVPRHIRRQFTVAAS